MNKLLKIFLIGLLCLGLLIGATTVFMKDIILTGSNAVWLDARTYTDPADIVTALSSNVRTLIVPNEITISSNTTFPSTTTIIFLKEGAFVDDENNADLTIQGSVLAPFGRDPFSGWGVGEGTLDLSDMKAVGNGTLTHTDAVNFAIDDTTQVSVVDGVMRPTTDNDIDLGTTALGYKDFFITNDILPTVDDTSNIGAADKEFNDLYIDGIAYLGQVDGGTASSFVDLIINGGSGVVGDYDAAARDLVIGDTDTYHGMTIVSEPGTSGSIYFADNDTNEGRIVYSHGDNEFYFYANDALSFTVGEDGIAQYQTFVNNANGNPNLTDTLVDIDDVLAETAWESFGPTDSGADNILTGMNGISAADWVEVKFVYTCTSTNASGAKTLVIYGRSGAGEEAASSDNLLVFDSEGSNADDYDSYTSGCIVAKIPLDGSLVFDLYYTSSYVTSTSIELIVTGYGSNN